MFEASWALVFRWLYRGSLAFIKALAHVGVHKGFLRTLPNVYKWFTQGLTKQKNLDQNHSALLPSSRKTAKHPHELHGAVLVLHDVWLGYNRVLGGM